MFPLPYDQKNKSVQKILIKIGEIIVLMGFLENWIDFWIWEFIGANGNTSKKQNIGKKITSLMVYKDKIDLLFGLVQSRFIKEVNKIKEFKKIHKGLKLVGEKRNRLIHAQWFIEYGNKKEGARRNTHFFNLRYGFNRKDGSLNFNKSFSKIKLSDLSKFTEEIRKAHYNLTTFFLAD